MGEFADSIRSKAAAALQALTCETCPSGVDPVIALISHLLEPATNVALIPDSGFAATETWIHWQRLIATRTQVMRAAITATLEQERPKVPEEMDNLRAWAMNLVLSTLDRVGAM